jgi:hypothetical protein
LLLGKGFDPGALEDKASGMIQYLVWSMSRDISSWNFSRNEKDIDSYRSREKLKMLHMLVRHGARWNPVERREINETRRSLMKMRPDYIMEFIWIMAEYNACPREAIDELMKPRSIRSMCPGMSGAGLLVGKLWTISFRNGFGGLGFSKGLWHETLISVSIFK